ncbi:uncharacterized protein LOC121853931 [Homarus americanus]|uniref:uncharacterized protein LOC121853931 n=1 Tax=Homarus americanus TaxID=6706 RepID=UPI001C4624C3|nr:uncharacterized protein LOC121853931 [Homarus americanus]XP_042204268.1 uncharacterized protein LOC121853931 [Homarus americanus]XP_042204269.1 uncharacterized protein LOC121853931 [Homarus americanus]XP_042204270.1 uncharacterized protein LOC121853931 [Homarus americanus]XP_042204271.1 uncharacterized protein LOC121853931 [Homarus americanus]XP_042204272.1 uncharacterized protein LOC121853931 [Homarus americanus]
MASLWEGEDMLVKLSTILRFCCDYATPQQPPRVGDLLPGYHRGQVLDELSVTDHDPWGQLLLNHRLEGPRYTILPTITVVSPWDDDDAAHHLLHDQAIGGSNAVNHIIAPTRVLPHLPDASTSSSFQRSLVSDAALNATQRFYDALRAVLHGSGPGTIPALGQESRAGGDVVVAELAPHVQETSEPALVPHTDPHHNASMSPLLQVCAALGVLVVVMVVLFHSHHFRRDCMTERRALRRVARRYHVTRAQDDVEKNDSSEVTDVTL